MLAYRRGTRRTGRFRYLYVGDENWHEGYRGAYFSAFTSKAPQLEWLGIHAPDAWPDEQNLCPLGLYADNGPGSSNPAQDAMLRLNIRPILAPRAHPKGKGLVERLIGIIQSSTARDPGGYARSNASREKERRRNAKRFADVDCVVAERRIVQRLIGMNAELNKEHLLTEEMRRDGVEPSSNAIFAWGIRKLRGVQHRVLSGADVYRALLDPDSRLVTVNGISHLGSNYNSERLREFRQCNVGELKIEILYTKAQPKLRFWVMPDGKLDTLFREDGGNRQWGTFSHYDIERWHLLNNAKKQVVANKRGRLTQEQKNQVLSRVSGAQRPKNPSRPEGSAAVRTFRSAEAELQQTLRPDTKPSELLGEHVRDATQEAAPPALRLVKTGTAKGCDAPRVGTVALPAEDTRSRSSDRPSAVALYRMEQAALKDAEKDDGDAD